LRPPDFLQISKKLSKRGHKPERTCLACRAKLPQKDLLRVVIGSGSLFQFDPDKRLPGRGAYICPKVECFRHAEKKRIFQRVFDVEAPPDFFEILNRELNA